MRFLCYTPSSKNKVNKALCAQLSVLLSSAELHLFFPKISTQKIRSKFTDRYFSGKKQTHEQNKWTKTPTKKIPVPPPNKKKTNKTYKKRQKTPPPFHPTIFQCEWELNPHCLCTVEVIVMRIAVLWLPLLSRILNNFIGSLVAVCKDEATSGQVHSQWVQGFSSPMNIATFRHFSDQFLFFYTLDVEN